MLICFAQPHAHQGRKQGQLDHCLCLLMILAGPHSFSKMLLIMRGIMMGFQIKPVCTSVHFLFNITVSTLLNIE